MDRRLNIGIALAVALLASGCSSIIAHRGYIADPLLTNSIQPGVDNRTSVQQALGGPSVTSQFGDPVWYYISSNTAQKPFGTPRIFQHSVLAVHFDGADNVSSINRTGMELVVRLDPDSDETPTLGRNRSFFEDLFGNIGQVGGAVNTGN